MKAIPYFANLQDGTHCYQAALKMVLTSLSGRDWTFEELDTLSGKKKDKWTWPTTSLLWLLNHGYEVRLIEEFSYLKFGERGKEYLEEKWGSEVASAQEAHSHLAEEQKLALEFAKKGHVEHRIPTWSDLEQLFKEDYLIICNINAYQLNNQPGYSGHFVVPSAIDPESILLHDPGLPPRPNLRVSKGLFEKAWGYPTEHEKNILALRKSTSLTP